MLTMIYQQMLLMVTRNMFPRTEISLQAFGGRGRERELKQLLAAAATPGKLTASGAKARRKHSCRLLSGGNTLLSFSPANKCPLYVTGVAAWLPARKLNNGAKKSRRPRSNGARTAACKVPSGTSRRKQDSPSSATN